MESYEDRVINGILKSKLNLSTPEQVQLLLNRDFEVIADPQRGEELWPCIWALASVLERQFAGTIYVNAGLSEQLPGPSNLGTRVVFDRHAPADAFGLGIGVAETDRVTFVSGDAKGHQVSYDRIIDCGDSAHPIACFALAGYLGYATLAKVVGLDPYHEVFAKDSLNLLCDAAWPPRLPASLVFIGLGQLGQAYLALFYFLDSQRACSLHLIDKDPFELPNRTTQILLPETLDWQGEPKASYLADKFVNLGWSAVGECHNINWGWKKPKTHGNLALMGLDKFDPRRMVTISGYKWLFEAGVGTSFVAPKITWHSFPGLPVLSNLFPSDVDTSGPPEPTTQFETELMRNTPGGCGWVTYNNISASAPAMGVLASAYLWSEVLHYASGSCEPIGGLARLWSPLLPYTRTRLQLHGWDGKSSELVRTSAVHE